MSNIKPGGVRLSQDWHFSKDVNVVDGLIGTIPQESATATFGTTAVNILSKIYDPGFTVKLDRILGTLATRIYGLNGSFVGSCIGYWLMQSVGYQVSTGGQLVKEDGVAINITGTLNFNVATYATAASYTEYILNGHIPVGSVPYAPFKLDLWCVAPRAANAFGRLKADSLLRIEGTVIPGT